MKEIRRATAPLTAISRAAIPRGTAPPASGLPSKPKLRRNAARCPHRAHSETRKDPVPPPPPAATATVPIHVQSDYRPKKRNCPVRVTAARRSPACSELYRSSSPRRPQSRRGAAPCPGASRREAGRRRDCSSNRLPAICPASSDPADTPEVADGPLRRPYPARSECPAIRPRR